MNGYIGEHPEEFASERGESSGSFAPPLISINTPVPNEGTAFLKPEPLEDDLRVLNQIRKWGCHFDGRDPTSFLERLTELQESYRVSGAQLLRGLPELLRGDALLWYRNFHAGWRTWTNFEDAFRLQYLPRRYAASLRRELTTRYQKAGEKFEQNATVMMTLMRRVGGFTPDEQLGKLYDHMHPDYKLYVRIGDVLNLTDLQKRASEYEEIEQEKTEAKKRDRDTAPPAVAAVCNRNECRWKCKQRGHTRFQCKRRGKKFCSQCGRDGVLTKDCHPPSGKATGAGASAAAPATPSPA